MTCERCKELEAQVARLREALNKCGWVIEVVHKDGTTEVRVPNGAWVPLDELMQDMRAALSTTPEASQYRDSVLEEAANDTE